MERNKRILIVEDDGNIYRMFEKVINSDIDIVRARAVDEAVGAIEDDVFDCYVVDLQIISSGLTFTEMVEYRDLEGYAFLKKYLWKGNDGEVKSIKAKTIICSRFLEHLENKCREDNDSLDGLNIILKDKDFEKKVASLIHKILL